MEDSPIGSVPLLPKPNAEWTGTLVAEWADRGLSGDRERNLQGWPALLGFGVGLAFLLALTSVRSVGTMILIAMGVVLIPCLVALWPRFHHRRTDQVTLTLDPEVLRLTRRSGQSTEIKELPRASAGLLIRWTSSPRSREAMMLFALVGLRALVTERPRK